MDCLWIRIGKSLKVIQTNDTCRDYEVPDIRHLIIRVSF